MRILSYLTVIGLSVPMLVSCVSKKKYVALEGRVNRMQSDSAAYESKIADLGDTISQLKDHFANSQADWNQQRDVFLTQINQQGLEISEKNQTLKERAERLAELQAQVDKQNAAIRKLRQIVADALISFSGDDLTVSVENGKVKVSLSEKLLFKSASVDIDPKGKEAIGKLGVVLKNNPDVNIMIVGYTDSLNISTARFRNNWDLSVVRAATIANMLQKEYGVEGERLTAGGQGEFNPVATNKTEDGRSLNRRTEIYLTPKLDALMEVLQDDDTPPAPNK